MHDNSISKLERLPYNTKIMKKSKNLENLGVLYIFLFSVSDPT